MPKVDGQRKGGLGLLVKSSFLLQFERSDWTELEAGRVGKLELRGSRGSLDLICCYLDPHSSESRRASFAQIASSLQPQSEVLTILFGDFNFVPSESDRWCKQTSQFTVRSS